MAETRHAKVEQGQTKIRNVPIAVTPEGFWCCPTPAGFQKSIKTQNPPNKPKSVPPAQDASLPKKQTNVTDRKPGSSSSRTVIDANDKKNHSSDAPVLNALLVNEKTHRPKSDCAPRKVTIEFGEPGTSDLKVIVLGKQGFAVKLSVHRSVLMENSSYFANRISDPCLEIDDCEDVEIYVETIGLMYGKELRQWLMKENVSRVLQILKVAEKLGFTTCIHSCLEYLEAVPWVGEEEEERVISSILRLECEGIGIKPVLKRVSSHISKPPKDTISHILDLVLKSTEERGRREMKSTILKLLKENNNLPTSSNSPDLCSETMYSSCKTSLGSLFSLFILASEPGFFDKPVNTREPVTKSIALEADNLLWLFDILADRQAGDEFAVIWSGQQELALLHAKLPVTCRHHVSTITARLFVRIGKGEILPCKDVRHLLIKTWLEPLINDYSWLQHGCRSFDRKVVEEGIGRTILTLPLEDQQSILLSWLGSFLKAGDNCPNLLRAFEVWWRRTFMRPFVEPGIVIQPESMMNGNGSGESV